MFFRACFGPAHLLDEAYLFAALQVLELNAHVVMNLKCISLIIIKITFSSIVIGLKKSYFPLIHLPSCCRAVCYWTVCYRTVQ